MTGDIGDQYETRWYQLIPVNLWSNNYYQPVSTPKSAQSVNGTSTVVWLYNANSFPNTVKYQTRTGAGGLTITTFDISVPPNGCAKQVIADGYAVRFFTETSANFFAISSRDANKS